MDTSDQPFKSYVTSLLENALEDSRNFTEFSLPTPISDTSGQPYQAPCVTLPLADAAPEATPRPLITANNNTEVFFDSTRNSLEYFQLPLTVDISDQPETYVTSSSLADQTSDAPNSVNILVKPQTTTTTVTAIEPSMREKVRRHFHLRALQDSPYWDHRAYHTLLAKCEVFCTEVAKRPNDEPFKALLFAFIAHLQPITYIERLCPQYLPVKMVRQSPELADMIDQYVIPQYKRRVEQIREAVRGQRIYIAFTIEEIELGDMMTLHRFPGEKAQFQYYLFIIIGFSGIPKPKKYLLKVVQLLENDADNLSDETFERTFWDTLILIWPSRDHLAQAKAYLTHIITDFQLLLDHLFSRITSTYPELSNLIHVPNSHLLLHNIEANIRKSHRTVCEVIDTVRMQWARSGGFRDKYKRLSSDAFVPPESFYRSAQFYCEHFAQAQLGVLKWKSVRFDETVARTFSDPEFRHNFDEFAHSSGELLECIERASSVDSHQFSVHLGGLLNDLVQMHQDTYGQGKDADSAKAFIDWYVESVLEQIGGEEMLKTLLNSGDYQLLQRLFKALLRRRQSTNSLSRHRLTKYFLIRCIYSGDFHLPGVIPLTGSIEQWMEPLKASQMRRCFPKFWHLFQKFTVPVPFRFLEQCAVLYCYAETEEEGEQVQKPEEPRDRRPGKRWNSRR